MITKELLQYVSQQKKLHTEDDEIRRTLVSAGWNETDVSAALAGYVTPEHPNVPTPITRAEAIAAVERMGKFKASKLLFVQSLNILKKDTEIVFFPVLSTVFSMVLLALYLAGTLFGGVVRMEGEELVIGNDVLFYSSLFLLYVGLFFVATYFKVGLTAIVYERINGGDIDFKEGMNRAKNIVGKIFVWSLLSATIGIILKIISDRSQWLGKLAASVLGAAWNIVTLFIAPTLLLDNVSVWQSVKNSGSVFKKTWGETLIMYVSFGLIQFLTLLVVIVLFLGGLFLSIATGSILVIAIVTFLFIVSLLLLTLVFASLSEIFKVALYSYARFGIIAEGFSPELIVGAIKESKKDTTSVS